MEKDDYFVVVFKLLNYFYQKMKAGESINQSGQNINSNQIKMHQSKGGIHGVPNAKKR
ncbi:hypothetical protein [Eremococcus coleocola]|uniref:Uncharacterized protein n=1 Tax=Eremococcus coleocola ACS-139-V-Col8 TaxID=908337 RepID=E4KQ95_9LACT|nr:hypothetical protein [Eremococcus coleocola]EFR30830.1 hypothetical protein HMPREF9257_1695 [Eremococcus coleocola ACS-139-V-Col8]